MIPPTLHLLNDVYYNTQHPCQYCNTIQGTIFCRAGFGSGKQPHYEFFCLPCSKRTVKRQTLQVGELIKTLGVRQAPTNSVPVALLFDGLSVTGMSFWDEIVKSEPDVKVVNNCVLAFKNQSDTNIDFERQQELLSYRLQELDGDTPADLMVEHIKNSIPITSGTIEYKTKEAIE